MDELAKLNLKHPYNCALFNNEKKKKDYLCINSMEESQIHFMLIIGFLKNDKMKDSKEAYGVYLLVFQV